MKKKIKYFLPVFAMLLLCMACSEGDNEEGREILKDAIWYPGYIASCPKRDVQTAIILYEDDSEDEFGILVQESLFSEDCECATGERIDFRLDSIQKDRIKNIVITELRYREDNTKLEKSILNNYFINIHQLFSHQTAGNSSHTKGHIISIYIPKQTINVNIIEGGNSTTYQYTKARFSYVNTPRAWFDVYFLSELEDAVKPLGTGVFQQQYFEFVPQRLIGTNQNGRKLVRTISKEHTHFGHGRRKVQYN